MYIQETSAQCTYSRSSTKNCALVVGAFKSWRIRTPLAGYIVRQSSAFSLALLAVRPSVLLLGAVRAAVLLLAALRLLLGSLLLAEFLRGFFNRVMAPAFHLFEGWPTC